LGKIKVSKNKDFYNYEQEPCFSFDMEFIRALIVRVKHNDCSDEDIRKAFESYTLLTLDLALMADEHQIVGVTHDQDKVSDIFSSRVKRF
jgi:hypothetical protein